MAGLHPVVILTGATGAIGSATAAVLVRRGARVALLARPSDRLTTLARVLGGEDNRVSTIPVDLSTLSSVRAAAREIGRAGEHVDALVNVAATFSREYRKTKEGFEVMLATNHLAPFLLTNLLRDQLVGKGRVITVTAPSSTRLDLDQLMVRRANQGRRAHDRVQNFRALETFGATKAANLLFSFELARRASRWEVRVNACYPGLVRSELMRESWAPIRVVTRMVSRAPARAAEDLADLAVSPAHEGTTGWFFKGSRRIDPPKATLDPQLQGDLWKRTAELVGLENTGF
ncbi:MAG: SDR family NAD(P)-dependent oxidoreductase [Candidatus Dormibacteraeota bacterium]|nr:SDR family NAD(P)-dependent oxidoreductase [Candidatus Dormibacteraeota bacterium]